MPKAGVGLPLTCRILEFRDNRRNNHQGVFN